MRAPFTHGRPIDTGATAAGARAALALAAAGALAACGDDAPPAAQPLEIAGLYESQFGGDELISDTAWAGADIREFSNDTNHALVQNPASDMFNPSKFAKYVWTEKSNENLYYCVVDYGLATLDEARATTKTADPSQPDSAGCGGFSWTKLLTPIEVRGTHASSFGGLETITSTTWSGSAIREFSNADNFAITQNAPDAQFDPGRFNKLVWTEPAAGAFYYCTADYGLASLEAARSSTRAVDATNPDTAGCGGFSWTKLSR